MIAPRGCLIVVVGVALAAPAFGQAPPEVCNGKDDDGNGKIDDVPGLGAPCGSDVGLCRKGQLTCVAGRSGCAGAIGPKPEACDGRDNDCDGKTDNFALCPGALVCRAGVCRATTRDSGPADTRPVDSAPSLDATRSDQLVDAADGRPPADARDNPAIGSAPTRGCSCESAGDRAPGGWAVTAIAVGCLVRRRA